MFRLFNPALQRRRRSAHAISMLAEGSGGQAWDAACDWAAQNAPLLAAGAAALALPLLITLITIKLLNALLGWRVPSISVQPITGGRSPPIAARLPNQWGRAAQRVARQAADPDAARGWRRSLLPPPLC